MMDAVQPLTGLCVLLLLGGILYWLRSKGLIWFTAGGMNRQPRQMRSVERLALTSQHSIHLVSVSGRMLLIAVSPGGCSILDSGMQQSSAEGQIAAR